MDNQSKKLETWCVQVLQEKEEIRIKGRSKTSDDERVQKVLTALFRETGAFDKSQDPEPLMNGGIAREVG